MQNLVHAWLIRVERLTADIDRKRAHLEELRGVTLGLQALEQEKERLLASALYISSSRLLATCDAFTIKAYDHVRKELHRVG